MRPNCAQALPRPPALPEAAEPMRRYCAGDPFCGKPRGLARRGPLASEITRTVVVLGYTLW